MSFFSREIGTLDPSPNGTPLWWHSMRLPDGRRTSGAAEDKLLQLKMWEGLAEPGFFQGKSVLDVGANDGFFSIGAVLAGASHVTAINSTDWITWPKNIQYASEAWRTAALEIVTGDFRTHPFGRTFDVVLLLGVIYHLEDVFGCIRAVKTLLNPGGSILIETRVTNLDVPVPVFESASDLFPTSERQGKETLSAIGLSNYFLPNVKAMQNLAFSFDMAFTHLNGPSNRYSIETPHRQMFRFDHA